jgi:hypothetical protein
MVMVGQHRRLSEPLHWTRGAKIAVIGAGTTMLAAIVAVVLVAAANAPRHRAGCIEVTFASTLGGAIVHQCGQRARSTCERPAENPGLAAHGALKEACERARLRYGTGSKAS